VTFARKRGGSYLVGEKLEVGEVESRADRASDEREWSERSGGLPPSRPHGVAGASAGVRSTMAGDPPMRGFLASAVRKPLGLTHVH
jgi:hypothetical protein